MSESGDIFLRAAVCTLLRYQEVQCATPVGFETCAYCRFDTGNACQGGEGDAVSEDNWGGGGGRRVGINVLPEYPYPL